MNKCIWKKLNRKDYIGYYWIGCNIDNWYKIGNSEFNYCPFCGKEIYTYIDDKKEVDNAKF